MANDKQSSFAERRQALKEAADQLGDVLADLNFIREIVALEATRMAEAEKRFSERRTNTRKARR